MPEVAPVIGAAVSCVVELRCCIQMTLHRVELSGARPEFLYTLTTQSGALVAADARAPVTGLVTCGTYAQVDGMGAPPYIPWTLWDEGPVTLNVVARDIIGRESPPQTISFDAPCDRPDAGVDMPDAGDGPPAEGSSADCGCRSAPVRGAPWPIALPAALLISRLRRRRRPA